MYYNDYIDLIEFNIQIAQMQEEDQLISANRRGVIIGGEELSKQPVRVANLTDGKIRDIGRLVYLDLQKKGFAHLEPQDQFVDGFVVGFKHAQSNDP